MPAIRSIALLSIAVCVSGCGVREASVSGEVTLNGEPLKEGIIRFIPVDGNTPTADAQIKDGKFNAGNVPVGEKRIEISAPKASPNKIKMIDAPGAKEVEEVSELLPERYNARSELTWKIETGKQQKQFTLTLP